MDSGRKDAGDKLNDKMTPDSSKSTVDKIKEGVTDAGDKIQRDAVPDSQKSTGQSLSDKASREKDHQTKESPLDKVKGAL